MYFIEQFQFVFIVNNITLSLQVVGIPRAVRIQFKESRRSTIGTLEKFRSVEWTVNVVPVLWGRWTERNQEERAGPRRAEGRHWSNVSPTEQRDWLKWAYIGLTLGRIGDDGGMLIMLQEKPQL